MYAFVHDLLPLGDFSVFHVWNERMIKKFFFFLILNAGVFFFLKRFIFLIVLQDGDLPTNGSLPRWLPAASARLGCVSSGSPPLVAGRSNRVGPSSTASPRPAAGAGLELEPLGQALMLFMPALRVAALLAMPPCWPYWYFLEAVMHLEVLQSGEDRIWNSWYLLYVNGLQLVISLQYYFI